MKKKKYSSHCLSFVGMLCLLLPWLPPAYAADWYAAPGGQSSAAGTSAAPWDLATALKDARVRPGDTVLLKGGTYLGKFTSTLTGTQAAPITVRSAPGEWAVIDGFATTTLAAPMDATTKRVELTDATNFHDTCVATIDGEQLALGVKVGNTFPNAGRSFFGTPATPHAAGALVVLGHNNLTVKGADTIYRDFEVQCSDPVRSQVAANSQNAPRLRGEGVWLEGTRTKLVNLVIHDAQDGVFASGKGVDTEVYGCLIYNNGYVAGGQYNGHGIYGQNDTGRKLFAECILWNNFSINVKQVSQTADTRGMDHRGIIAFNSGSPAGTVNRQHSLFIGANNGRADDVTVTECLLYNPPATGGAPVLRLGYATPNGKIVVTDTVIAGGVLGSEVNLVNPLTWRRNRSVQQINNCSVVNYVPTAGAAVDWDDNDYWNTRGSTRFDGFYLPPASAKTFAQWKAATGFDATSRYDPVLPTVNWVYVRPNRYEAGRAHIAIFNWTRAAAVPVNLAAAGLAEGQSYTIRNVQNWHGAPLATGTYSAASPTIALAFDDFAVEAPVGHAFTPVSTIKANPNLAGQFLAAVVVPFATAPLPPIPPIPPVVVVDPVTAQAEAWLQSWLAIYEPYAATHPAFAVQFADVIAELKKPRP